MFVPLFCTKCGKEGFPVRVACLNCNSTLEEVPGILEPDLADEQAKNKVFCRKLRV